MPKVRISMHVVLTLESPFLFRGLAAKLHGVDATSLRNDVDQPIIPADQIRGILRDGFEDLAAAGTGITAADIDAVFGKASSEANAEVGGNLPERSSLDVTDFVAGGDWTASERTRIAIDPELGAVKTGMLQVYELAAPLGAAVAFTGRVSLVCDVSRQDVLAKALKNAFSNMSQIGAIKSAGFGRVLGSRVEIEGTVPLAAPKVHAEKIGVLAYRVAFDRPILVDAEWIADNAIKGSPIVPGAVFKGALARKLADMGVDCSRNSPMGQALAKLLIRHAFPYEGDHVVGRPLPLSLVTADGGKSFADALSGVLSGFPAAGLMWNAEGEMAPALHPRDWKPAARKAALKNPCRKEAYIPSVVRTHTAIDHGGLSSESQLYTTLACSISAGKGEPRCWRTEFDFSALDEGQAAFLKAIVESGLEGIGKTQAIASFSRAETHQKPVNTFLNRADHFALLLETPAYLLDAASFEESDWDQGPIARYKTYFQALNLDLIDCLAQQAYRGGYIGQRYRTRGAYYPFLLTVPGSIFLVKGAEKDVRALIDSGLPAAPVGGAAANWENCPFMPESGFGQVSSDYCGVENPIGVSYV